MNISSINTYNPNTYNTMTFEANAKQYKSAVKYLKSERRKGIIKSITDHIKWIARGIKNHYPMELLKPILKPNPKNLKFINSSKGQSLKRDGIKVLDIDKLEGIQFGIDVFNDLSMREIVFLAYRTINLAVRRGCERMCKHCFQNAVPANKTELSSMPYEDFQKISDGFTTINKRINKTLKNKTDVSLIGNSTNDVTSGFFAELTGFFYDSDGISVIAKDRLGKEHDFIDLTETFHKATGKRVLFDTAGWNPKNKILQERAEKYAEYFSQPNIINKVEQVNLSINTFNPLYSKAYKLGYRAGIENDLSNPEIQKGKVLYDRYIDRMANMLATLGFAENSNILMTYAGKFEANMDGMYLSDLELIMKDVQKRCNEILKEKYTDSEFAEKSKKIDKLISSEIRRERGKSGYDRCVYAGRYKTLYSERNPKDEWKVTPYSRAVSDINKMTPDEYKSFLDHFKVLIDTNGQLYYMEYDTSLRSMGKELKLSTNGKQTPKINNIETRK